ncbi:UbiH/UbiF family hydroxylase [Neisseriaceae bacterium TC5R-5]|nr:UbiH/UbiF family hydroxylase [Neisseriaceae bacterium TC5R-5]
MNENFYDVIVVGAGLVGASLALALNHAGKRVALLEGKPPMSEDLQQGWDARIYAISPANRHFLQQLSAWPGSERIGSVQGMQVYGDAGGEIAFSASDAGTRAEALAWIVENRWLLATLQQQLQASNVDCLFGTQASHLQTDARGAQLELADGRSLRAALIVGADGANSWVRQQLAMTTQVKPYQQSGVVANFNCERPHGQIARQWFTGGSILAWLPMAGNRISIVWSSPQPAALLALDAGTLANTVAAAGANALGQLEQITPPAAFALRLQQSQSMVAERVALVGDAAHTVHPLAGQGVNLGFQDAAQLALLIQGAPDAGDWLLLRRYQRQRSEAVTLMQQGCDGLYQLFHSKLPGLSWLRNTGLSLTNRLSPLKRQLARQAIGY